MEEFEYTPKGYLNAKKWLIKIGEFDKISNRGLSTDGYSIVHEANSMIKKINLEQNG